MTQERIAELKQKIKEKLINDWNRRADNER